MKPDLKTSLKTTATFMLVAGIFVLACGLGYLCLTPKHWQAVVKIRVEARGRVRSDATTGKQSAPNESPYMEAERQYMRSDEVLARVIDNLHLREKWGNRLQPGALMGTNQALQQLRAKADILVIPRTSVLEIQVTSDDSAEVAPIANEIAGLYCNYCQSQRNAASQEQLAGVQKQWEQENTKLSQARDQLEKIVSKINQERAAVASSLYTPEAYESMQTDRDHREAAMVAEEAQINRLKGLKPDELKALLPTLVTNEALDACLERSAQAQRALTEARAKLDGDPAEIKRAAALAQDAEHRMDQAIVGVISEREADLAMHKSMLGRLDRQLKTARTNVDELSPDNPAYLAARLRVEEIEAERERLKDKLANEDAKEALSPLSLSAQVVDSADSPSQPISPDRHLGLGIIGGGVAVCGIGLALFGIAAQFKTVPKKRIPEPLPFSKVRQN